MSTNLRPGQRVKIVAGTYKDFQTATFISYRGLRKKQVNIQIDGLGQRKYVSASSVELMESEDHERTTTIVKRAKRSAESGATVEINRSKLEETYNRVDRLEKEVKDLKKQLQELTLN